MSLAHLLRAAAAFIFDPDADQEHSRYPSGNIRSVRDARTEGFLPLPNPHVLAKEVECLHWIAFILGACVLTALGFILGGSVGLITLDINQYLTAIMAVFGFGWFGWGAYQGAKLPH
jgi:hypothetical protein